MRQTGPRHAAKPTTEEKLYRVLTVFILPALGGMGLAIGLAFLLFWPVIP